MILHQSWRTSLGALLLARVGTRSPQLAHGSMSRTRSNFELIYSWYTSSMTQLSTTQTALSDLQTTRPEILKLRKSPIYFTASIVRAAGFDVVSEAATVR